MLGAEVREQALVLWSMHYPARRGDRWRNPMSDLRDINRDAKWRRLAMNQIPGGDIGASRAAW